MPTKLQRMTWDGERSVDSRLMSGGLCESLDKRRPEQRGRVRPDTHFKWVDWDLVTLDMEGKRGRSLG